MQGGIATKKQAKLGNLQLVFKYENLPDPWRKQKADEGNGGWHVFVRWNSKQDHRLETPHIQIQSHLLINNTCKNTHLMNQVKAIHPLN